VYLQSSAQVQRVSHSARGNGCCCCCCCARTGRPPLPSSVAAVAVQDCLTHLLKHRCQRIGRGRRLYSGVFSSPSLSSSITSVRGSDVEGTCCGRRAVGVVRKQG
jgi:hypothetical protein